MLRWPNWTSGRLSVPRPCGGRCRCWAGGEKKSSHAAECDTRRVVALRRAFIEDLQSEDFTCLVGLREKSRLEPDIPAEAAGLTTAELRVLCHQRRRLLATVHEVYLAPAALGGHLGRTGDGPPGWQTLWLGRQSLRLLVEGGTMAAQLLEG